MIGSDNAVADTHMIAIDETMGFRPLDRLVEHQLEPWAVMIARSGQARPHPAPCDHFW